MSQPRLTSSFHKMVRAAAVILALSAMGCANTSQLPDEYRFNTLITPQGLKLFELTLPSPSYRLVMPSSAGATPIRRKREEVDYSEKRIKRVVEQAVEVTEYCRSGFYLLGRYAGETAARVRGECRENANEEDKKAFPDTLHAW